MRAMKIICLVLAMTATAIAVTHARRVEGAGAGSASALAAKGGPGFSVSGHAIGLLPGAPGSLALRVTNRQRFTLNVASITARVGDAGPGCPAANVSVGRFRGHLKVKPHHSRRVQVAISLAPLAPDACQGASFPLSFKGRARRG